MNNRLRNTRGNTGKGMINGRNRRTPQWRREGEEKTEEGKKEGKKGGEKKGGTETKHVGKMLSGI